MSMVNTVLWLLGLAFLAALWLAVTMSLFEMGRGLVRRLGVMPRRAGARSMGPWARGLVAGALGYLVVVVIFALLNLLAGRSLLLTPALLGQSLLGEPVGGGIEAAPVLVYNGLHLVVFLALGLVTSLWLLESERHPKIWYPALVVLLALFLHAVGFVLWLAAPAGPAIPAWSIVIASAAAGIAMGACLVAVSPWVVTALLAADLEA